MSTGAAGSGTTVLANRILQAAGLDPQRDIRAQSLGVAQSVDALKDGKIDAFFWNAGLPTASILDLVHTPRHPCALHLDRRHRAAAAPDVRRVRCTTAR